MADRLTINLHYGRAGRRASSRWCNVFAPASALALLLGALHTCAQYPGQIAKKDKDAPVLRAVAVLEWTGDLSKPKTSRLVPITVYDGEQLQDGGEYLARPEPLAVAGGVEYILQQNGAKIGLFDIRSAGQQEGSWVGFGNWKPMPVAKPKIPDSAMKIDEDVNSDRPVLHRKRGSGGASSGDGSSSDSGAQAPAPDPDRPTLHKAPSSEDSSSGNSSNGGSSSGSNQNGNNKSDSASSAGTDKTTATKSGSSDNSSGASASDPDRPQLKRGKAKQQADEGYVESLPGAIDADRPRLMRGKSTGNVSPDAIPTLLGMPKDMEQAVAVSDPRNRPEHPWNYAWANSDDEEKMKADLEEAARKALGLDPQPAPAPKRTAATTRRAKPVPPPEPAPLADEEYRVLELAYGSGATLVLTAHTDGPPKEQKFVTLIAQPDLYGSLSVLFKNVTDGAHLDDKPRMRLIDAVDVLADNRGELLFEMRGATQRQFALYRVLRGTAKELFVTGGGATSLEQPN